MADPIKCACCGAQLLVQTRIKHGGIIRSWKCQYCEFEVKDEGDVTPEQVLQVMSVLNTAPRSES